DHGIHPNRNVVAGNDILRRHVEHARPQIDAHELLDAGNNDDEPRAFDAPKPAERENHTALIFAQDFDGRCQDQQDNYYRNETSRYRVWHGSLPLVSSSFSPSISALHARLPGRDHRGPTPFRTPLTRFPRALARGLRDPTIP